MNKLKIKELEVQVERKDAELNALAKERDQWEKDFERCYKELEGERSHIKRLEEEAENVEAYVQKLTVDETNATTKLRRSRAENEQLNADIDALGVIVRTLTTEGDNLRVIINGEKVDQDE
jgi:chromosome segregation ATPase